MLLYLVQHAEAKKEEEDPERGLTDNGFRDIARTAVYAQKLGVRVSAMYHSGKKRAMQTAKVLADYLKPEEGIVETEGLAPLDDPEIWSKRIAEVNDDIMLVSHLPCLAKLAGLLLCGDREKTFVDFRMAGIVCLKRFDDGKWALEWMIAPEMIA
ncbi:MAG TPA: phosphohistidine phosphatase SixA [Nitrospirota bacterium]|nr:phosphohistidine phosphatase SixA [Nitrospirota bacterium]